MKRPQLQHVRLGERGLAKVLGDLEARIMSSVWEIGEEAPARFVHERVRRRHAVQLLTVVTVLNKLVAKGLLKRERREGLLHYSARYSREEFELIAARRLVEGMLGFGRGLVAASLVDVLADTDPEALEELGRLVRAKLAEQGHG